ncbi:MAG: hypothetical protein VCC00_01685 [Deltaproteobacteria bacterium]
MPFSVFLVEETMPLAAVRIAGSMQEVLGGMVHDHVNALHTRFGWIASDLSKDHAERLAASLTAAGFAATAREEGQLPGPLQVVQLRRAELRRDGLSVGVGLLGESRDLAWESLSLVSLSQVQCVAQKKITKNKRKLRLSRAGLAMGLPMPVLAKQKTTQIEEEVTEGLLLQLVFAGEGVLRELRPRSFDYSYLAERMRPSSRENFRLLLNDLTVFAGEAAFTAMARDLAAGREVTHTFGSDKEMLRFTLWRLGVLAVPLEL